MAEYSTPRHDDHVEPNSPIASFGSFAHWLVSQGRTREALAWAQRAREHDPLAVSGIEIGWILFHSRRYDEAAREFHSVLAVQPDDPETLWNLGFVLIANHQPEEAIPVLEKALSLSQRRPAVLAVLIRACAHARHRNEALRLLEELKRRRKQATFRCCFPECVPGTGRQRTGTRLDGKGLRGTVKHSGIPQSAPLL